MRLTTSGTRPVLLLLTFLCSCAEHRISPAVIEAVSMESLTNKEAALPESKTELPSGKMRLKAGTPLWLMISESISSKTAKVGDPVRLQVVGDVKIEDLVVVANRAPASGTVTAGKAAGMAWRPGGIEVRLDSVTLVDGQQQPLRFQFSTKGEKNTPTDEDWRGLIQFTGGFGVLYLPFAPLQHGKQAIVPKGTIVRAAIQSDAVLERASVEASQPKPAERGSGPPSVTIYNSAGNQAKSVTIWCGTVNVGKLKPGRRFNFKLPPGTYWFRSEEKGRGTPLKADAGEDYYVRVDFGYVTTSVEHDEGEAQAAYTSPAIPKEDLTKLPIAALQVTGP